MGFTLVDSFVLVMALHVIVGSGFCKNHRELGKGRMKQLYLSFGRIDLLENESARVPVLAHCYSCEKKE